jgi:hypothetical protein
MYKILFANKEELSYKYEWEVDGAMNYAPDNFLPCVAYNDDGSILKVKEPRKPKATKINLTDDNHPGRFGGK